jgi:hypothetical protein
MARLTKCARCGAVGYCVTARFCTRCGEYLETGPLRRLVMALKVAFGTRRRRRAQTT